MDRAHPSSAGDGPALLVLVLGAQFLVVADASIMNVALPSIQTALGFSASGLQWVLSAYVLTYGGCYCWEAGWATSSGHGGCCWPGWAYLGSQRWSVV